MASLNLQWTMHIDLHETTNSDFIEFRPAKAARDGFRFSNETILGTINPLDCPGATKASELFKLWDKSSVGELTYNEVEEGLFS